jgi:Heterokaryon incompatibility protein (HET)
MTDISERSYVYKPLRVNSNQIRVLELDQQAGEKLSCRIRHVDLDEADFTCLSYPWGDSEQHYRMIVKDENGQDLGDIPLTRNLHNALRNLRDSPNVPWTIFWIDQISVNQIDQVERSHQVELMSKLYRQATRIITYLGEAESGDTQALNLMHKIHAHYKPFYETPDFSYDKLVSYMVQKPPKYLRYKLDANDPVWLHLCDLLAGSWTERLWMVQENVLNPSTFMLRGHHVLDADEVLLVINLIIRNFLPRSTFKINNLRSPFMIESTRTKLHTNREWEFQELCLTDLMDLLCALKCQDPRDRIYALLSIAEDTRRLNIVPDYTKSVEEVFIDVATQYLRFSLAILQDWIPVEYRDHRLPSWVPSFEDFGERDQQTITGLIPISDDYVCEFEDGGRTLVLRGIRVATVLSNVGKFEHCLLDVFNQYSTGLSHQHDTIINSARHILKTSAKASDVDSIIYHTMLGNAQESKSMEDESPRPDFGRALRTALQMTKSAAMNLDKNVGSLQKLVNGITSAIRNRLTLRSQKHAVHLITHGRESDRALCVTEDERVCLSPPDAKAGDLVVLLEGGSVLYILRPLENGKYTHIGDAYVHGEMSGESLEIATEESFEEFRIV